MPPLHQCSEIDRILQNLEILVDLSLNFLDIDRIRGSPLREKIRWIFQVQIPVVSTPNPGVRNRPIQSTGCGLFGEDIQADPNRRMIRIGSEIETDQLRVQDGRRIPGQE